MLEINKIYQGDCLEVMRAIDAKSADMILADLPYGLHTACKWDVAIPLEPLWEQYKRIIKDNGAIVLTASQPFASALVMSNLKMFKYEWIWEKTKATGFFHVKFRPMKNYENILVFSNGGCAVGSRLPMKYFPQGVTKLSEPKKRSRKNISATISNVVEPVGEQIETNYPTLVLKFPSEGKTFHPYAKTSSAF